MGDGNLIEGNLLPLMIAGLSMIVLAGLRILPVVLLLPIFNLTGGFFGVLKGGMVAGLSLLIMPILWRPVQGRPDPFAAIGDLPILLVVAKELFIGLAIGFVLSMPIWVASTVGNIIDTQSGEQLGGMVDPGSGEDTTANGTHLGLVAMAVYLEAGFFSHVMMPLILESYSAWPIDRLGPEMGGPLLDFMTRLFSGLMYTALVIAMPFVVGMLLIDIGLAYASRFVPTISPFFLSMGGKVAFVSILLVAYHQVFAGRLLDLSQMFQDLLPRLAGG